MKIRPILKLTLLILFMASLPQVGNAVIFNVTRLDDPSPGNCDPGDCSLREAVNAANGNAEPNIINLIEGNYTLNFATEGDLDVNTNDLTIVGPNRETTIIDATGLNDRIFDLDTLNENISVEISGVTLQNGNLPGSNGGAIFNQGNLNLHDCVVQLNHAINGGAISSDIQTVSNTITIQNCIFFMNEASSLAGVINNNGNNVIFNLSQSQLLNNTANSVGGAININGSAHISTITDSILMENYSLTSIGGAININGFDHVTTIARSTISENDADSSAGGININGSDHLTTIIQSTIANNRTNASAGGINNNLTVDNGSPITNIINSTISGNRSNGDGGGIFNNGPMALFNVTITGNRSDDEGDGSGLGGGIFNSDSLSLENSILAGNTDPNGDPDCFSTLESTGHNLIGISDSFSCTINPNPGTGDILGTEASPKNPGLGPLQDNGGPTFTHALLVGSEALDGGDPTGCRDQNGSDLSIDQRGQIRPTGANPACDIGAFEAGTVDLEISKSADPDPVTVGDSLTYTLTVTNLGPDPDLHVTLTDTLPQVGFVSATASQGNCGEAGSVITCNLGALTSNQEVVVTVVVVPDQAGTITNAATVLGAEIDFNTNNNTVSIDTTVISPLAPSGEGCSFHASLASGSTTWALWMLLSLGYGFLRTRR